MPDERRVQRIMSRARVETALGDLILFAFGRIWLLVLELFAVVYKLFHDLSGHPASAVHLRRRSSEGGRNGSAR